jgi:hypothetical protein
MLEGKLMPLVKEGAAGFQRINELMTEMIKAAEVGDKVRVVKLSRHFIEDTENFADIVLDASEVTDADMQAILSSVSDEQLIKDAASADQIKTASVKQ